MPHGHGRVLIGAFASLLVTCSCGAATGAQGSSTIDLDGRPLAINSTCVNSNSHSCIGPSNSPPKHEIVCNVTGPLGQQIEVFLDPDQAFVIDAKGVTFYQGRGEGQQAAAAGGVSNFDPQKGANINVTIGGHQLSGSVRC